jgi:hypothetical protein
MGALCNGLQVMSIGKSHLLPLLYIDFPERIHLQVWLV